MWTEEDGESRGPHTGDNIIAPINIGILRVLRFNHQINGTRVFCLIYEDRRMNCLDTLGGLIPGVSNDGVDLGPLKYLFGTVTEDEEKRYLDAKSQYAHYLYSTHLFYDFYW